MSDTEFVDNSTAYTNDDLHNANANADELNCNKTGYQPVMLANSQTNAGGVGVYVTDKLTVILLGKNELNSNCEDIWLRISNKIGNDSFIVGVIYRHPKGDVNNFLTALNKKLDLLSNKRYYLFGDFNINVNSTVNN